MDAALLTPPLTTGIVSFLVLVGTAIYLTGLQPRITILDRPGEGIHKVCRWMEGSEEGCIDAVGMKSENFRELVQYLTDEGLVASTCRLPAHLRVAMTLNMPRKSVSYRTLRDVFQVSCTSISMCINEVISALVDPKFYYVWVSQPSPESIPLLADAYNNPKLAPLTRNCLGAIDGTHIPCTPPATECAPFRNRRGFLSFNVLGAVTFDGLFCYLYAGWEGSANDSRVFKDALQRGGMKIPDGWHYLADAGYGMGDNLQVPYRGVRYHLREIGIAQQRPKNEKELYNLRHSMARNVVERAFGRLKKKFKILVTGSNLHIDTQRDTVYACCALLNYMQMKDEQIDADLNISENTALEDAESAAAFQSALARAGRRSITVIGEDDDDEESAGEEPPRGAKKMELHRVEVGKEMWRQYQTVLQERA